MTPLSISAFWGYANIARSLLENGANINTTNTGTKWTALHCAAFQGNGPVIMRLMMHNPDLTPRDNKSRTAADYASAMDSIWPLFADAGCTRTSKQRLIEMEIVQKAHLEPGSTPRDLAHFSRPGSSYAMRAQGPAYADPNMEVAAITGDVLAAMPEEPFMNDHPSLVTLNDVGY
ncbi:hypothetical protein CAPTEDRAFT_226430 [Capitella teleta]|uniref:Uncharacterized protein n=1 Tax=Capitella teleta TaxID=283909 RepID=R7U4T1_CAPTE|nr:hypothetical protein CAPTEDRAFT_226430 [Capitella teleta]|eukprot:ELU00939.1 hypothetical protein CAPTEDRAFT_226430 [Capitella teleta]